MGKHHEKDFDSWIELKKKIHKEKTRLFFHDREIWFCSLGANVGYEQDGSGKTLLRPVVIYKKFNNQIFLGIPLTKTKKITKHYFQFSFREKIRSNAILSQVRLMDAKRLNYKAGTMKKDDFRKLKKSLIELIQ